MCALRPVRRSPTFIKEFSGRNCLGLIWSKRAECRLKVSWITVLSLPVLCSIVFARAKSPSGSLLPRIREYLHISSRSIITFQAFNFPVDGVYSFSLCVWPRRNSRSRSINSFRRLGNTSPIVEKLYGRNWFFRPFPPPPFRVRGVVNY